MFNTGKKCKDLDLQHISDASQAQRKTGKPLVTPFIMFGGTIWRLRVIQLLETGVWSLNQELRGGELNELPPPLPPLLDSCRKTKLSVLMDNFQSCAKIAPFLIQRKMWAKNYNFWRAYACMGVLK